LDTPEAPEAPALAAASGDDEPLWKRFAPADAAAGAPESTPSPFESLEARVLGLGARARRDGFIAALFGGSRDAYESALGRLEALSTWTEAAEYINEEIFKPNHVHLYSESATAFTHAVEAQYGPTRTA
jgi:hypothetical protein